MKFVSNKIKFAEIKKYLVAVVGFMVIVFSSVLATNPEIIPSNVLPYIQAIIGVVITTGVYKVKNKEISNES